MAKQDEHDKQKTDESKEKEVRKRRANDDAEGVRPEPSHDTRLHTFEAEDIAERINGSSADETTVRQPASGSSLVDFDRKRKLEHDREEDVRRERRRLGEMKVTSVRSRSTKTMCRSRRRKCSLAVWT